MNTEPCFAAFVPAAPLDQLIELFWYCQDACVLPDNREKVLPNGCVEVIVNLGAHPLTVYASSEAAQPQIASDLLVSGLHTTPFLIGSGSRGAALGICFKPGGAYPVLGFPVGDLQGRHTNLSDIWPVFAEELQDRLRETADILARFRLVEQWLVQRITADPRLHPAVAYALQEFQRLDRFTSVACLTEQVGLSAKRFIDLFRTQVGLTPKQYHRVQRFQQVLYAIHHAQRPDWADLALAHGYHDQAHFIHDFGALAGTTPTVYRDTHTADLNHLPL